MQVKQIERTANVAWSPKGVLPLYLAAGTAAQQLDASFSTSAALEVYAVNLQDPGNDLSLVHSVPTEQRFHAVTWGSNGGNAGTIVGGCDGGVIQLFNANKLISKEESLIGKFQKHTGNVRALDFNKYQSNLLASGAAESEIFIWDLNNPANPMSPGSRVQPPEDLTSLEWNNQVQHILATAFSSRCVVWDLRKNDPIIKLTDTSCRLRWCSLAWNPDVATQLCLASEDDQSPFIQLWDLRFATSPVKVMAGHHKGVLSLSWSQQDTEMLLSCGKDNKLLCWNPNETNQGYELICDMTSPSQWNFSARWCPGNPALFSTCSFDGHVSVCSLFGGPQQPQTSTKIADSFPGMELFAQAPPPSGQAHATPVDLRKPPKWLKRPATARFGFGGKLVITEQKTITLCQVTSEPAVVARANLLDGAVRNDNCLEYCRGKVAAASDDNERTLWQFITASFSSNPKEEFISLLGFQRQDISAKLSQLRLRNGPSERLATLGRSTDTESDLDASDDVTESRSSTFGIDGDLSTPRPQRTPRSYKISTTDDVDGLICESLLLGDIPSAVELCVEDGRWADAIILAMMGGSELLANTQHRYLQENPGILSKLVLAAVTENWQPVIENCDASSWREALVAALTHSTDEFPALCETLGARLEPRVAQFCYLCAGNLDQLVTSWLKINKASSPNHLQDLVELIMLVKRSIELRGGAVNISGQVADILSRYAIILSSEGNLEMALAYLETSQDEGMAFLRERIYRAAGLGGQPSAQYQPAQQPQTRDRNTRAGYPSTQQQSGRYPQQQQIPGYPDPVNAYPATKNPAYPANVPSNNFEATRRISNAMPAAPLDNSFGSVPRTASPALGKGVRAKHVLDPSVASAPAPAPYYPAPGLQGGPYDSMGSYPGQSGPTSFGAQGAVTQSPYGLGSQGMQAPFQPAAPTNHVPPPPSVASTQPPGWNDPPPATKRPQQKKEIVPQAAPITTPLFGGPPAAVNGSYDPYQQIYQQQSLPPQQGMGAYPPPAASIPPPQQPLASFPPSQQSFGAPPQGPMSSFAPPQQPIGSFAPPQQQAGSFPPPPQPTASFPPSQPQSASFPPLQQSSFPSSPPPNSFAPPQQSSRPPSQPGYNGVPSNQPYPPPQSFAQNQPPTFPPSTGPFTPAPVNPQTQLSHPAPAQAPVNAFQPTESYGQYSQPAAPPAPQQPVRKAIPEEHIHLQTVLNELRNRCVEAATNAQVKRKLDDVSRKLDGLYDCLADGKLSATTLESLHGIAQRVQNGDYTGSLSIHSQLVSGPDFSQIASFMPGIKILLQTALQLQVFL